MNSQIVHLLWTGGWDSTFRLLQLLLEEKRVVQPYYIIDYNRPSVGIEIDVMRRLRSELHVTFPETNELLLPTIHHEREQIEPDDEITRVYQNILRHRHLGNQYEWLCRFCKQKKLKNLELCIEKLSNHNGGILPYIKNPDNYPEFIAPDFYDEVRQNMMFLFEPYNIPLADTTKDDMLNHARKMNWMRFMNQTWFCMNPTKNLTPCGVCKPCKNLYPAGFQWRLPLKIRVNNKLLKMKEYVAGKR